MPHMDRGTIQPDTSASERLREPPQPLFGRAAGSVTGNNPDLLVAQTQKVASCAVRGTNIVDSDPSNTRIAAPRVPVRVNHRKIADNGVGFAPNGIYRRNPHDAIDAPPME